MAFISRSELYDLGSDPAELQNLADTQPDQLQEMAAIETDPKSANPHFDLAKLYARLGTVDKAIAHYTQALKLDPQFATAHFNLGAVLLGAGEIEEAKRHYEAGLREFPDSTVGQFNYGMILAKTGDPDRAVRYLRRAAQLSPKNPQIAFQLGIVLNELQRFSQAAELRRSETPRRSLQSTPFSISAQKAEREGQKVSGR